MARKRQARASNGMGSIRQRTDGRWEARYTSPDGSQKSIYGKTEKDVSTKLRTILHEIDTGSWSKPSNMTVKGWMQIWLNDYQTHTTIRTVNTYRRVFMKRVIPVIGDVPLSKLSQMHVRKVTGKMAEEDLSAKYTKQCLVIMSVAFNAAVEVGVLKKNPAKGVKTPRIIKKKMTIVDRDLFPAFIAACEKHMHGNAILFMLLTGLRAGELRGLCWHDIDFPQSTMEVQRQLPMAYPKEFCPPKDGSVRTIEMMREAMDILNQQKVNLERMRLNAGEQWIESEITKHLVFRSATGNVLSKSSIYITVKSIGAEIGLPDLHPHDLRHSYAVAALRSGIDVKTVQTNMGHKDAAITLNTYAAYTQDAGRTGAEKFSAYWQDALKKPSETCLGSNLGSETAGNDEISL